MSKYLTTWLLVLSIFIAESHSYTGRYAMLQQNWVLTIDRTQELQWNVKDLSDEINAIIYFFAMYFYLPNRVNKTTAISFIILCVVDLAMWVHNYKTLHYGSVYVWVIVLWGLIFFRGDIKTQTVKLCRTIKKHIRRILAGSG